MARWIPMGKDYLETQEGKNLPVRHCIYGEDGLGAEWRDTSGPG